MGSFFLLPIEAIKNDIDVKIIYEYWVKKFINKKNQAKFFSI